MVKNFLNRLFVFELNVAVASTVFGMVENVQFRGEDFAELNKEVFELDGSHGVRNIFNEDIRFGGKGLNIFLVSNAETVLQNDLVIESLAGFFGCVRKVPSAFW